MEILATVDDGILIAPSERSGMFEVEINGVLYYSSTATIHEIPGSRLSNLLGSHEPASLLHRILVDPTIIGLHALVDCEIHLLGVNDRTEALIGTDTFFERSPQA